MPSTIYRRKSKITMTPDLARDTAIHAPIHQWLARVARLSGPPHLARPALVADPIRDHVVRARVDEHAHATLEQLSDVMRILIQSVSSRPECFVNVKCNQGEIPGGRVDTNFILNPVLVQEGLEVGLFGVTFEVLTLHGYVVHIPTELNKRSAYRIETELERCFAIHEVKLIKASVPLELLAAR